MTDAPACPHSQTRLVAKDQDAEYIECLSCGAILEKSELGAQPARDSANFNESLSDA